MNGGGAAAAEHLRVGGEDDGKELKLQGEKVKRAKNFKYLGSTVSNNGRCEEVRRRIQAGDDELEEGVWSYV